MAFSGLGGGGGGVPHSAPMAEINMIPLVDVMLVLLIIFMITAPLLAHKIKIDLPQASTVLLEEKPDTIVISLMADGRMFLNDVPIDREAMVERLADEAQRKPQPELHLHVDRTLQFQALATVMADAQNAGMVKVGIATDPIKGTEGSNP
jgi:biopolymer transport protein ExbD